MPELPEVEATVRYLRERSLGYRITRADVRWARTIATSGPDEFDSALRGTRIREVFRRGKFVGVGLEGGSNRVLLIHLRMSGSIDVVSHDAEDDRHDRVVLYLDKGRCIRFNDARKFGRMYLSDSLEAITGHLGIDPFDPEFSPQRLHLILQSSRSKIKPLLLDQRHVAGLGNIYVDEALWKSRIHPLTPASSVTRAKAQLLHTSILQTLTEAIELAGTDFGDGVVHGGMYQPKVYGRSGEACQRCATPIVRTVVGQRGTHLCSKCQRVP